MGYARYFCPARIAAAPSEQPGLRKSRNPKRARHSNAWGPRQASETQDEDALPWAEAGARQFRTFHRILRLRLQWCPLYFSAQQLGQLGEVRRHAPGFVLGEQLGRRSPPWLILPPHRRSPLSTASVILERSVSRKATRFHVTFEDYMRGPLFTVCHDRFGIPRSRA